MAFACCMCEAGELAARTLSSAAGMVRDAALGLTDGYIRSAIDYFEVTRARPSLAGTLVVTTWTRLGFDMVDFGWGEAAQMGSAELPLKEVALLLPNRDEGGGTVLVLGLPVSAMESFQELVKAQCSAETNL
ncbi:hypothetical protein Taro_047849 [Colocasia esculenta]|uniref:Uncharacterized protein n=1 Tax=Colocasia esculenta TaxID=4460 RepID=A0A843X1M6_COLES|nr:hypothetical protein [Colocasia esculenta]